MNKYFKFIIFYLFFSTDVYAIELKLQCQINTKFTPSNGNVELGNGTASVEIKDEGKYKYISVSSTNEFADDLSVSTIKTKTKSAIYDDSTDIKWDITNVHSETTKHSHSTRITIDRNTGELIYTNSFPIKKISVLVTGSCKKIDQNQKKF